MLPLRPEGNVSQSWVERWTPKPAAGPRLTTRRAEQTPNRRRTPRIDMRKTIRRYKGLGAADG